MIGYMCMYSHAVSMETCDFYIALFETVPCEVQNVTHLTFCSLVITACTTKVNTNKFYVQATECAYIFDVWFLEQKVTTSPHIINLLVLITKAECVH
jgi:hypothetical protein